MRAWAKTATPSSSVRKRRSSEAKTSGEQYLHYQLQMHSELAERLSLEHRLRAALDEEQFVLFYQPQVNVPTGHIDGVEALLRWQDPQEGLVAPARFLPVLESSGMIVPVGEWVLRKAADDCRRWQRLGLGPVRVAVNVSALQVSSPHVCRQRAEGGRAGLTKGTVSTSKSPRPACCRISKAPAASCASFATKACVAPSTTSAPAIRRSVCSRSAAGGPAEDRSRVHQRPARRSRQPHARLQHHQPGLGVQPHLDRRRCGNADQLEVLRSMRCDQSQGFLHSRPIPVNQLEALLARQRLTHRTPPSPSTPLFELRDSAARAGSAPVSVGWIVPRREPRRALPKIFPEIPDIRISPLLDPSLSWSLSGKRSDDAGDAQDRTLPGAVRGRSHAR